MTQQVRTNARLLTRAEVESLYGVTKRYLELAKMRGDGPAIIRIGRLVRYRPQDIETWILANRTPQSQDKGGL